MTRAPAIAYALMWAAVGIVVSGCAAGHSARSGETGAETRQYVLRWEVYREAPGKEDGRWEWRCYGVSSEAGCSAVTAWMETNRRFIHPPDGMTPLRYAPAKELFCFQDDGTCRFWELRFWDVRARADSDAALRNWSKVELLQLDWGRNLPVGQFEKLQHVFKRFGTLIESDEHLDRIRAEHAAPSPVPDWGAFVLVSRQSETSPLSQWRAYTIDDADGRQAIAQWILANYDALKCAYVVSHDLAVFPRDRLYWLDSRQGADEFAPGSQGAYIAVSLLPWVPVPGKGTSDHREWAENLPLREIETLKRHFRAYGKPTVFDLSRLRPSATCDPNVRLFQRGAEAAVLHAEPPRGCQDLHDYPGELAGGWFALRWEERHGPPDDGRVPSKWLCYVMDRPEGRARVRQWIKANGTALVVPDVISHLRLVPARQLAWCYGEVMSGYQKVWNLWLSAPDCSPNQTKLDLLTSQWIENLPARQFEEIKRLFRKYGRSAPPNRTDLVRLLGPAQHRPVSFFDGGCFVLRIEERSEEGSKWVNYRIVDEKGRRAVEDWVAQNYEALVCAEVSQTRNPPRATPPRSLYWYNSEVKTRLEMGGRTFVSRGGPEDYEHIQMLSYEQSDALFGIFKEHGALVEFEPQALLNHMPVSLKGRVAW